MNTSHYPTLELCKKLGEISFPDTENAMVYNAVTDSYSIQTRNWLDKFLIPGFGESTSLGRVYPCPSVMEMLDRMPAVVHRGDDIFFLKIAKVCKGIVCYETDTGLETIAEFENGIPNALTEMILWLHENKYILFNK